MHISLSIAMKECVTIKTWYAKTDITHVSIQSIYSRIKTFHGYVKSTHKK